MRFLNQEQRNTVLQGTLTLRLWKKQIAYYETAWNRVGLRGTPVGVRGSAPEFENKLEPMERQRTPSGVPCFWSICCPYFHIRRLDRSCSPDCMQWIFNLPSSLWSIARRSALVLSPLQKSASLKFSPERVTLMPNLSQWNGRKGKYVALPIKNLSFGQITLLPTSDTAAVLLRCFQPCSNKIARLSERASIAFGTAQKLLCNSMVSACANFFRKISM